MGKTVQSRESLSRYSPIQSLLLIFPLLALLLVFYLYPLYQLFPTSLFADSKFTLEHYKHFFSEPLYVDVLLRTVRIGLVVTFICLIIGYPLAHYLSTLQETTSTVLLLVFVLLPFWTSILVRSYSWVVLFQTHGTINKFLLSIHVIDKPLNLLYNEFAVTVGMVHILLPYMTLPIYSVLKGLDPNLIRAARNLGGNNFWVFALVILPLSLPGVGAGVMFVFILSLGFYITPAILGGLKTLMISTLIDQQINRLLNWEFSAAIAVMLLLVTLVMILIFNRIVGLDKRYRE